MNDQRQHALREASASVAQRRGCMGKQRYPSKRMAMATARLIHERHSDWMSPYRCKLCGKWHLGHSRARE